MVRERLGAAACCSFSRLRCLRRYQHHDSNLLAAWLELAWVFYACSAFAAR